MDLYLPREVSHNINKYDTYTLHFNSSTLNIALQSDGSISLGNLTNTGNNFILYNDSSKKLTFMTDWKVHY